MDQEVIAKLWGRGKSCEVPKSVAACPECNGTLTAECAAWHPDTNQPHELDLKCENEWWDDGDERYGKFPHRWFQSDCQPVRDAVDKWAGVERL